MTLLYPHYKQCQSNLLRQTQPKKIKPCFQALRNDDIFWGFQLFDRLGIATSYWSPLIVPSKPPRKSINVGKIPWFSLEGNSPLVRSGELPFRKNILWIFEENLEPVGWLKPYRYWDNPWVNRYPPVIKHGNGTWTIYQRVSQLEPSIQFRDQLAMFDETRA